VSIGVCQNFGPNVIIGCGSKLPSDKKKSKNVGKTDQGLYQSRREATRGPRQNLNLGPLEKKIVNGNIPFEIEKLFCLKK
jgi:hypothetical protein